MRSCFLLLLLPACATRGRTMIAPPCVVDRDGIVVRAEYVEEAERLVGDYVDLDRRVRDMLGVHSPPTPEIWLMEEEFGETVNGLSGFTPPIVCLERGHHDNRQVVAHELSHHYQRRWPARLPTVVDEGLADLVAGMARDQLEEVRERHYHTLRRTRVQSIDHVLELPAEDFEGIPHLWGSCAVRSVGFAIVDKLGVEGLLQMCQRANALDLDAVPSDWFEPVWSAVASRSFQQKEIPPGLEVVTLL